MTLVSRSPLRLRSPALAALALLPACWFDQQLDETDTGGTGTSEAAGPEDTGGMTLPPADSSATSGVPADTTTGRTTDEGGTTMATRPDAGAPQTGCDLHVQDCDRGWKCVPISTNGSFWNDNVCVPVVDDPQGAGESCHLEDPATGVDDCDFGQVCQAFDDRGDGACTVLCVADEPGGALYCENPAKTTTAVQCQTCYCTCQVNCNPLADECPAGEGCYPVNTGWFCAADGSGRGGALGDECEFINACDPGLTCIDAQAHVECEGVGCCALICDVTAPNECPQAEAGVECVPWWVRGEAPVGFENVGVCSLPQ